MFWSRQSFWFYCNICQKIRRISFSFGRWYLTFSASGSAWYYANIVIRYLVYFNLWTLIPARSGGTNLLYNTSFLKSSSRKLTNDNHRIIITYIRIGKTHDVNTVQSLEVFTISGSNIGRLMSVETEMLRRMGLWSNFKFSPEFAWSDWIQPPKTSAGNQAEVRTWLFRIIKSGVLPTRTRHSISIRNGETEGTWKKTDMLQFKSLPRRMQEMYLSSRQAGRQAGWSIDLRR
jgi:hypothetical protein